MIETTATFRCIARLAMSARCLNLKAQLSCSEIRLSRSVRRPSSQPGYSGLAVWDVRVWVFRTFGLGVWGLGFRVLGYGVDMTRDWSSSFNPNWASIGPH